MNIRRYDLTVIVNYHLYEALIDCSTGECRSRRMLIGTYDEVHERMDAMAKKIDTTYYADGTSAVRWANDNKCLYIYNKNTNHQCIYTCVEVETIANKTLKEERPDGIPGEDQT